MRDFPRKHDLILRYAKTKQWTFNPDAVRVPYDSDYKATVFRSEGSRAPGKTYTRHPDGKVVEDWWRDMPRPYTNRKKGDDATKRRKAKQRRKTQYRYGGATEKPLALYKRMIEASSNPGDVVLDPFCGCATTPVAAELLDRQWVGIDIWDGAHEAVLTRFADELLVSPGEDRNVMFTFGEVTYLTGPPTRTDEGETAAPFLQVTERYAEPSGPKMTRAEMVEHLLAQNGCVCQGCDRRFDDVRYLQLDHNRPRSDGGWNHITNRVLLCGPCNQLKSNIYTLSGLRRQNHKLGYMARTGGKP
ncbi:MAG: hypothetical protein F4Y12_14135 [Acidimicrobiaceae bacterium]|nr:hypothetical protein [Acidimicrobiaceae bacterium]MYH76448.1 hypothetical protein [Acidimicrobiaceae bacterium]MYK67331.1 hypothetical protein [Gemmatimonadota bacterium]